jgi:hypothetical protein
VPQPSLDDAFDKLRWAKEHFEVLRRQIEPFEQRDAHRVSVTINENTGEYIFHVHDLEAPNADWGLVIGDCLHNARTALDYLVVRLFALVTGQEPRNVEAIQFPIYDDPGKFKSCTPVAEMRKHPPFSGYLARIEELQPFNRGNASIWGVGPHNWPVIHPLPSALERLSNLDNTDKHRVVHAAWLGAASTGSQPVTLPPGFKIVGGNTYMGPLKEGAEVGRWQFATPLPSEWEPDEMDMKRCFPLEVAFDEPLPSKGVLEVLPFCLWGVEAVLALFSPVFEEPARPPLPVTAIPNAL